MSEYLRVLVVHRQDPVAEEIKKQFDRAGWTVHLAHSGLDGLLAARKESFSLILSAVDLPVITGIEMVRAIRNFSFNVNTPAVFLDEKAEKGYEDIYRKLKAKIFTVGQSGQTDFTSVFDSSPSVSEKELRLSTADGHAETDL